MIRRISTTCAAALTGVALFAVGPMAYADDVDIEPYKVAPGGSVTLTAPDSCVDPAKANSGAFAAADVPLTSNAGAGRGPVGTADIAMGTTPGPYDVLVECQGGQQFTGQLEVSDGSEPNPGPHTGGGGLAHAGTRAGGLAHAAKANATAPKDSWGLLITIGASLVLVAGTGFTLWRSRRNRA
ncbi:hypothetical protein J4573_34615 [Actinomadura barringtoniae]|uniref:Sortase n=1 Tax=Actinomadura barringtoniae TaxID=1427535 RepID=A0A939PHB5_9ACTN|nr:hypothetical protein [Actinomadura barringtoniae]MBO2452267.1 hypothetical protein [Actinomadura barringtoniae]